MNVRRNALHLMAAAAALATLPLGALAQADFPNSAGKP
jgi:hypothetical protein